MIRRDKTSRAAAYIRDSLAATASCIGFKIIFPAKKTVSRGDFDHLNSRSFLQDGAFCRSPLFTSESIAGWTKARLAPCHHSCCHDQGWWTREVYQSGAHSRAHHKQVGMAPS